MSTENIDTTLCLSLHLNAMGTAVLFTHARARSHVAICRKMLLLDVAATTCHGLLSLSESQDSVNFTADSVFIP